MLYKKIYGWNIDLVTNYLSFLNYAIETFNIILPYSTYTKLYIKKKIFARNNKIGDKVSRTICQDLVSNNISPELSRFDVKSYLDCYWLFTDFHWLFDRVSQEFSWIFTEHRKENSLFQHELYPSCLFFPELCSSVYSVLN